MIFGNALVQRTHQEDKLKYSSITYRSADGNSVHVNYRKEPDRGYLLTAYIGYDHVQVVPGKNKNQNLIMYNDRAYWT